MNTLKGAAGAAQEVRRRLDKPLTLNKFAEGMESAMREFNHEYRKERRARGMVTNVELSESAEDWLPQTHPVAGHKE